MLVGAEQEAKLLITNCIETVRQTINSTMVKHTIKRMLEQGVAFKANKWRKRGALVPIDSIAKE